METSFDKVIREHLELRARNAELEQAMPLDDYQTDAAERSPHHAQTDEIMEPWGGARAFDWGD